MKHCKKQVEDRYDGISVCVVCGAWHRFALGVWCKTPAPELMWVTRDRRKIRMADMEDTHLLRALKYFKAQAVAEALGFEKADDLQDPTKVWRQQNLRLRVEALEDEVQRRGLDKWDKFLGRAVEGLL